MTPKQEAAMQMALEALTFAYYEDKDYNDDCDQKVKKAREKLREALAEQPERQQEPVAWVCYGATVNHHDIDFDQNEIDAIPLGTMLYTSPQPSKPWVGLTEKEHTDIAIQCGCMSADWVFYGATVERILKEKNS